jgi:hypothetical protein
MDTIRGRAQQRGRQSVVSQGSALREAVSRLTFYSITAGWLSVQSQAAACTPARALFGADAEKYDMRAALTQEIAPLACSSPATVRSRPAAQNAPH